MLGRLLIKLFGDRSIDATDPSSADRADQDDAACPYRTLVERILDHDGEALYAQVLEPWLAAHPEQAAWLASLRERGRDAAPAVAQEESWDLYALSRLCELLVLNARETAPAFGRRWPHPWPMREVEAFFSRLGLDVVRPEAFHPFHHEITGVLPAQAGEPAIAAWQWPCFMLGSLLVMRAGVTVAAYPRVLVPGTADKSTLYWAYSRSNRPCNDQAHGWGSNSSWRTAFRRDYRFGNACHFNVDGEVDLALADPDVRDEDGLSRAERIALLMHRCLVTPAHHDGDLYPYRDRYTLHG